MPTVNTYADEQSNAGKPVTPFDDGRLSVGRLIRNVRRLVFVLLPLQRTKMELATSAAAKAAIHWVGPGRYREPWLRYNPQIYAEHIPELNWQFATWDIGVRAIESKDGLNGRFLITFQFACRRAPHHVLTPGLAFGLFEGPGKCVWRGTVYEVFDAPRDPGYWYIDA